MTLVATIVGSPFDSSGRWFNFRYRVPRSPSRKVSRTLFRYTAQLRLCMFALQSRIGLRGDVLTPKCSSAYWVSFTAVSINKGADRHPLHHHPCRSFQLRVKLGRVRRYVQSRAPRRQRCVDVNPRVVAGLRRIGRSRKKDWVRSRLRCE